MTSVYTFHIQQLERVYGRNREELEKARRFLQQRFQAWNLREDEKICLEEEVLRKIITAEGVQEEESARLLVDWADKLGAIFKATKLSSAQIRTFFGEVRTIEQRGFSSPSGRRRFILLLPKLEYAAARAKTEGMNGLKAVLTRAIQYVQDDPASFRRFVDFFEAILAYHKAYGGD